MKYYLYVSDTKVDMLFSQIPENRLKKIAADLNINLGIFSLNLKGKENQEKTRYEKLKLVVNYIEKNEDVGSIDQPGRYFKGSLPMHWGPFMTDSVEEEEKLVYFGGDTTKTILGLGGSMHHVIGSQRGDSRAHSHSFTPFIASVLTKELGLSYQLSPYEQDFLERDKDKQDYTILQATALATSQMEGPPENLEFLAKRLVEGLLDSDHVVLGTPLYVAIAD